MKPLSRAIYLLKLQNISIEENDTYSDPEFLMDIMTFNEKISEATTPEDINQLYDLNEEKVDECIHKISKAFQDEDITNARIYTIKLRYFMTIQERIKELRMKSFV